MSVKADEQRNDVLMVLAFMGPITDWNGGKALGIRPTSFGARRNELMNLGCVRDVGTEKNPDSGVSNTLWDLTDAGWLQAQRVDPAAKREGLRQ